MILHFLMVFNRLQLNDNDYYKHGFIIEISTLDKIAALEVLMLLPSCSRMELSRTRINSLIPLLMLSVKLFNVKSVLKSQIV